MLAILFGVVIISKNPKWKRPRFWLGFLSISFGLILFDGWGTIIDLSKNYPFFSYSYYRLVIAVPMAMWFYVRGMIGQRLKWDWVTIALLILLGIEITWVLFSFITKGNYLDSHWYFSSILADAMLVIAIIIVFPSIYLQVKKYQQKLENNFSEQGETNLLWLNTFIALMLVLAVMHTLILTVNLEVNSRVLWVYFVWLPLGLLIFYMVYKGLTTPEIIHSQELVASFSIADVSEVETTTSYPSILNASIGVETGLKLQLLNDVFTIHGLQNNNRKHVILKTILHIMNAEELYREPRLGLAHLARKVGYSSREISEAINGVMLMSFSDFINRFRVEDVKAKMVVPNQKLSILGLAYEAGFNSKSSFNAVFKRFEGCSPTSYLKRMS